MFYILLTGLFFLLSNQPALAEEQVSEIFQGIISSTRGAPSYLVVNERKIYLDEDVEVKDHKERELSVSELKAGKWVYIVSEKRSYGPTALRIYLLPKRIKDYEKRNYPFMKREEEPEE